MFVPVLMFSTWSSLASIHALKLILLVDRCFNTWDHVKTHQLHVMNPRHVRESAKQECAVSLFMNLYDWMYVQSKFQNIMKLWVFVLCKVLKLEATTQLTKTTKLNGKEFMTHYYLLPHWVHPPLLVQSGCRCARWFGPSWPPFLLLKSPVFRIYHTSSKPFSSRVFQNLTFLFDKKQEKTHLSI